MREEEDSLDALMYLFEHHIDDVSQIRDNDPDLINKDMLNAGYRPKEIIRAMQWFDDLYELLVSIEAKHDTVFLGVRVYSSTEQAKITAAARGFLQFLEQKKMITPILREVIIDRAMSVDNMLIDVQELKWVVLMILYNYYEDDDKLHFLEDIVLFDSELTKH